MLKYRTADSHRGNNHMESNVYRIWRPLVSVLSIVIVLATPVGANAQMEKPPADMAFIEEDKPDAPRAGTFAATDPLANNGAATHVIPIQVPPGRQGVSPKIALVYNSGKKNGIVGVGWDLDLGSIQRSTKRGVCYPGNPTCEEEFTVGGAELVPRAEWGTGYYGLRRETQFTRYEYLGPSAGWIATAKDGRKFYYGRSSDAQQSSGSDVYKWCLDRVKDTNGNYMELGYSRLSGEIYPEWIEYTGNVGTGIGRANRIEFKYSPPRTDSPAMYSTGFRTQTVRRLEKIEIHVNGSRAGEYVLTYSNPESGMSTGRSLLKTVTRYDSDGESLPETVCGYTTAAADFGPVTPWAQTGIENDNDKNYTLMQGFADFNGDGKKDLWVLESDPGHTQGIYVGLSICDDDGCRFDLDPDHEWARFRGTKGFADFDGDGKQDLWVVSAYDDVPKTVTVHLSNGTGFGHSWEVDVDWAHENRRVAPFARTPGKPWVGFADLNGDGKKDMWFVKPDANGFETKTVTVRLSNGSEFLDEEDWQGVNAWASIHWKGFVDFNGDGKEDLWFVKPRQREVIVRLSNGSGFENEQVWADDNEWANRFPDAWARKSAELGNTGEPGEQEQYNEWVDANGWAGSHRKGFADLNGDGKPDLWFLNGYHEGGITHTCPTVMVRISTGYRFSDAEPWVEDDGWYERGFADFNGDGKQDFWFLTVPQWPEEKPQIMVRLSTGFKSEPDDSGFIPAQPWPYGDDSVILGIADWRGFTDVNGDGKPDLWFVEEGSSEVMVATPARTPPDLLRHVTHSTGASTVFGYKSSSEYEDASLPLVLQTVSSITRDDGLGNTVVTEYDYGLGHYRSDLREFMGFGERSKTTLVPDPLDPERLDLDKTLTKKSFYHQSEYLKGRPYQTDVLNQLGILLTRTTQSWDEVPLGQSDSRFLRLYEKEIGTYENGALAYTTTEAYTYYTAHGSIDTTTTSSDAGGPTVVTDKDYGYFGSGSSAYPLRMTRDILRNGDNSLRRMTKYQYGSGTGNLLYEYAWNSDRGVYELVSDMGDIDSYDDYGNVTKVKDAKGYSTWTEYDVLTQTFPVKSINAKLHEVKYPESDYDYTIGKPGRKIDANDNSTYYTYDGFGRTTQVDYPDDGQVVTTYNDDASPRTVQTAARENAPGDTVDTWAYLDGFGRTVQTVSFGESGESIVTKYYYDDMGRNYRTEGPFFMSGFPFDPPGYDNSGPDPTHYPWVETSYDRRGRPEVVTSPIDPSYVDTEESRVVTRYAYGATRADPDWDLEYDGLSTTVTDPDGNRRTEVKDYLGRVVMVIEHTEEGDLRTRYKYNVAGDLVQVDDALNNTTEIRYNSLGQRYYMDDPDMGVWTYTYDRNGNLEARTDGTGEQTITYTYDELNRVVSKIYSTEDLTVDPPIDPPVTYGYDLGANGVGLPYSVTDRYDESASTFVRTAYDAYDEMGRIEKVTKEIDSHSYIEETEYDLTGKVLRISHDTGPATVYEYYPGSNLVKDVKTDSGYTYATLRNYQPGGSIGTMDYNNGTSTVCTYDEQSGRLTSIESGAPGHPLLLDKTYVYSPAGDIKSIMDGIADITYSYEYDSLHRLVSETDNGSAGPDESVSLYTYDSDPLHAVDRIARDGTAYNYHYDDNGSMVSVTDAAEAPVKTITYNPDNMPVRIENTEGGSSVTSFAYDAGGEGEKGCHGRHRHKDDPLYQFHVRV